MLRNLISAEALAVRKRPSTWILLGVWSTMSLLFGYVLPYVGYAGGEAAFGDSELPPEQVLASLLPVNFVSTGTQGMPVFGGAIALIFGALLVGSPYGWGVVKTAFTQRASRIRQLAAAVLVTAIAMLFAVVATLLLSAVGSVAIASTEGEAVNFPPLADVLGGLGAGWLILTMWSAAGVLLATITRGTALSIGLGLVWSLVVENLIRGIAGSLDVLAAAQDWLPGANAGSLIAALLPDGAVADTPGVVSVVSGGHAVGVLAAYIVAFIAGSMLLLRKRDVT